MNADIWVADDDKSVRFVLAAALRDAGYTVREFDDGDSVIRALADATPRLLLTDIRMPGADGITLLEQVRKSSDLPVIVMSAYTDVASTAAAYRAGARDYLPKPFDLDEAVQAAARTLSLGPEGVEPTPVTTHTLMGESPAMREVFRLIGRVAASDLTVLITGETGTGKELVARALHDESARNVGPFVAMNTAAVPADLLESELFGHEAGAFTGANRRHVGRFEQAEGGTLFLDEIGDMPLSLQTRLLRVLAGGEFYRVGGRQLIRCNVRVVAATHQDLDARVERGDFRADLKHRLDVVRIVLPPLRERPGDVALLAPRFLATASRELGLPEKRFTPAALRQLARRPFPGNVRELENLCRRLLVMAPGAQILPADLDTGASPAAAPTDWTDALKHWAEHVLAENESDVHARARDALDSTLMRAALAACDGHRQNAAAALGVGRNTLTRKLGPSRKRRSD